MEESESAVGLFATIPVFTFYGSWLVYVKSESVLNFYVHFLLELSHFLFLQQHRLDADWTQFLHLFHVNPFCLPFLRHSFSNKGWTCCFKGFWKIFREAWKGEPLQILLHFLRIEVVVGAFLKSIHQIAQRLPLNICGAKWSVSPTTYLWSIWAIMPGHWTPSIDKCVINWYWKY